MRALPRIAVGHPRTCLALLALVTLALAAALPRLELRTDGAALHPRGDPTVRRTAHDRRLFDDPEEVIVLLTARPDGPALTSAGGLRRLVDLHDSVAALPGTEARRVRSAASLVDVAASRVGSLGTFLEEVPDDRAGRAELVRRLRRLPWAEGLFLSADGRAAALYVPLEPGGDRQRLVARLERWAEARADGVLDLRLTGPVVAETRLGERILDDLARLVPVMMLVVMTLLLVCLRTPGGLLVAMGKTLVVLVWTGGVMALAGVPVTLVTTILPVLLLALAVTDEVHVVARLQARLAGGVGAKRTELLATLEELHRPVVHTSVSTAIGFLSFLSATIAPLAHFGALAAVGILSAMLMTFTLTPALVELLPRRWFVERGGGRQGRWQVVRSLLTGRRRHAAALAGLGLLVAGVPGLLRLRVQDSWIENFDPDSALVRAEREFNARFWGTYRFDLVLTGPPGHFHRPEGAALVAATARAAATAPRVGGVLTYLQPLDTVAELLGLPAGTAVLPPDALEAVVRVGTAYAGRTDLHRLLTPDGGAARLLVLVNSPDYRRSVALAGDLDRKLARLVEGSRVTYHTSGDVPLALATVRAIVRNQLRSVAWTLLGVGLLLLVVNRSLRLTLAQLVPPAAAAWLILAAMGYLGMPLGVATSMFTALTLGVGVDLALHVTYAYQRVRRAGAAPGEAVIRAFERTAAGRRWSTVVLALGFLVLAASAFAPNHDLGLLLSAAMLASYLTTALLVPWMLAR